jgi:cytosine deaminase
MTVTDSTPFELVVRNARLLGQEGPVDIGIAAGLIRRLEPNLSGPFLQQVDAGNRLVTEAFADPHLHLCKVHTLGQTGEKALQSYQGGAMGQAMTAIEEAAENGAIFDEERIYQNACRAVEESIRYGSLRIRAFADVGPEAGLKGLRALLRVRSRYAGTVDLQVVAFPQLGVVRSPGAEELIEEAIQEGADLVGGIPWIEFTREDELLHIRKMFAIARKYDRGLSMLVDDAGDAGLRSLEMLAVETIRQGWEGRVMAQHARAMSLYPAPYLQKLIALLKRAKIAVVSDPHTGPLHARVRELLAGGVCVCLGQDDISDAYYPYGRGNMLEVAFLASHLLWMTTSEERETLYRMITGNPSAAMGLGGGGVAEGCAADLVVLQEDNLLDAFRNHEAPAFVIRRGKVVAKSVTASELFLGEDEADAGPPAAGKGSGGRP